MELRSAKSSDAASIADLWMKSFHDEKNYIDFYFLNRWNPRQTPVLVDEKGVAGMIHLLPCKLIPNKKAFYWYAVAIRPDLRGKGLFRSFATSVLNKARELGFQNLCVPAPGLAEMYRKIGFENEYRASENLYQLEAPKMCKNDVVFSDATAQDFASLAQKEGSVLWDLDFIAYALEENLFCGGKNLSFSFENKKYVFTAIKKDDYFSIDNTNISPTVFESIKEDLSSYLNAKKLMYRTFDIKNFSQNETSIVALSDFPGVRAGASISFTLA